VHDRDKKEVSDRAKFKQSEMLTPDCAGRDAKHTSFSMQQRQERRTMSVESTSISSDTVEVYCSAPAAK
jgi:hypothetical protein